MRWNRLMRFMGIVVVAAFLLVALTPAPNAIGRAFAIKSNLQPADAIVVLGAGMLGDGTLNDFSFRRAMHGIVLFHRELAPLIVFSGSVRPGLPPEPQVRAVLARDLGIPASAILEHADASTTREEALQIFNLLQERGVARILLVTESFHLRRAAEVFRRVGFEVVPAPSDTYFDAATSPASRLELTRRLVEEGAAFIYYRVAGYI